MSKLFSLLVFLSLVSLSSSANLCNSNDKKALLQIKSHFKFDNALSFTTWDSTTDCCTAPWGGIECDANGRVTTLALGLGQDVVGDIPPAIGKLPFLQFLTFAGSSGVSGPIPPALANLANLYYIDLSENSLTGPIPSLGRLTKLRIIILGSNKLSGPIPISLGKANLTALDISNNKLKGDASFLFGSKKTLLTSIKLSNNLFKFDISNVDLPPGLKTLDISHNMIYGSLPIKLGQLPLQSIDVSFNRLCGPIPTGRRMKQFSPVKFANNKCLCGRPLAPCKSRSIKG